MARLVHIIPYVEGDGLYSLPFEWLDNGVAVDLDTYTSIVLKVRRPDGTILGGSTRLPLIIDDGPAGLGHWDFTNGDLQVGDNAADIVTVDGAGKQKSFPDLEGESMILRVRKGA